MSIVPGFTPPPAAPAGLPADPSPAPSASLPAPSSAGDIVPLSSRVATLSVLRVLITGAVLMVAHHVGQLPSWDNLVLPLAYLLAGTALGGAIVSIPHRPTAVGVFGLMLCMDGVAVQAAQGILDERQGADLVLAVFLAAVCLLASFRTGVKLAAWQSLLLVLYDSGQASGLFPQGDAPVPGRLVAQLVMIWLLVLVICGAAAINERELRRRRYDAEALQHLASQLHEDETPDRVLTRTMRFAINELEAGRVLACEQTDAGLRVVTRRGSGWEAADLVPAQYSAAQEQGATSRLLSITGDVGRPARLLQLDPVQDPWLAAQLPRARRLIVLPMTAARSVASTEGPEGTRRLWIVFEHRGRGLRLERRVLATAGQACATAALAMSRAILFQQSRAFARTDGLTGLVNRRALDELLAALDQDGSSYTFALADVDHFKAVNDTHGHQVGDDVLKIVATTLAAGAPPEATVARYGGEEFAVVMPDASIDAAFAATDALRAALEVITQPVPVTASFGLARSGPQRGADATIAAADAALYRAKTAGRNRVMVDPDDASTGQLARASPA
jgi:two-component system, cell cycle response regulator